MNPFALTAEERAGAMMAPARTPDVGAFMDNLGALRAMLGPSVASRMQTHGEDQEARWDAGERGPTPLTEDRVWLADDVAGALLGPMGMAGVIKAYHGSPHRFDRFDMSKIGTGEGAQAYGHGLYFAESPGVAVSYRDALSTGRRGSDAPKFNALGGKELKWSHPDIAHDIAEGGADAAKRRVDEISRTVDEILAEPLGAAEKENLRLFINERDELRRLIDADDYSTPEGALYTTRLDVEPEDLLDWDAPLSQQSEKVRAALEPYTREMRRRFISGAASWGKPSQKELDDYARQADEILERTTGRTIIEHLEVAAGKNEKGQMVRTARESAPIVSQRLREAGIPGIRYLDQGSRASGDGTRNFVIFDDSLISIESVE